MRGEGKGKLVVGDAIVEGAGSSHPRMGTWAGARYRGLEEKAL